jgi:hypothetical protein
MRHTFLYEPGIWTLSGMFWSADAEGIAVDGRTEISHGKDCWMLAGRMRVLASPPVELVNVYTAEPPRRDALASTWTSENSTLGKLRGVFACVGTCILSLYRSEQGGYYGTEHLRQITADQYEAHGVLLMDGRRLSSWQVTLTR